CCCWRRGNLRRDRPSDRRFSRRHSGFDRLRFYRRADRRLAGGRVRRARDIRGEHRRKDVSDYLVNYRISFVRGVARVVKASPIQPIRLRRWIMVHHLKNVLTIFLALTGLWLTTSAQTRSDRFPQGSSRYGYSNNRLSGTWRLNVDRSDDPRVAAERATRNLDVNDRQRAQENLSRRLGAPRTLAIDRRWRTITMASSQAPQVTFEANGVETVETTRSGRERRTRVTLSGERLTVRSLGEQGSDYEAVFEPLDGGRRLRVTRSLYTERLNREVVVRSVYDRVSDVAQLDLDRDQPDRDLSPGRNSSHD